MLLSSTSSHHQLDLIPPLSVVTEKMTDLWRLYQGIGFLGEMITKSTVMLHASTHEEKADDPCMNYVVLHLHHGIREVRALLPHLMVNVRYLGLRAV
jgi:hypothetical protein